MTHSLLQKFWFTPRPFLMQPLLLKRRGRADRLFCWAVRGAVGFGLATLFAVLLSVVWMAAPTFVQTEVFLSFPTEGPCTFKQALNETLELSNPNEFLEAERLFDPLIVQSLFRNPKKLKERGIWIPVPLRIGSFLIGTENKNTLSIDQKRWLEKLKKNNRVRREMRWSFFTEVDAQQPERAGILGAAIGSLLVVVVALAVVIPLGVASAIFLEEFCRVGRLSQTIEVTINNLAAVPSVVFGLLGLAVFLGWWGLPRSSGLVAGLTLSLMLLPIVIVSSRSALRTVPRVLREAALGLGASPAQMVFGLILPQALPGILTGALISTSRAFGESACLLMVGMMAFVTAIPESFLSPATVLPIQVYQWVDRPIEGFSSLASAGILVLLLILSLINGGAWYLRRRFDIA